MGALCVLSVLWVVNEAFNRKLMDVDKMIQRRMPRVLQYGVIQMILFVLGIMLAISVVTETGVVPDVSQWCDNTVHNVWVMGALAGAASSVLDTFVTSMSFISLHKIVDQASLGMWLDSDYMSLFVKNGIYWKLIAYSSAMGGNFLLVGSVSGLALMKMERIHVWWFFKNVGWMSIMAWALGLGVLWGLSAI